MIKFENTEVMGWKHAIRGMRNPMNSWDKIDSDYRPIPCTKCVTCPTFANETWDDCDNCDVYKLTEEHKGFMIGPNDLDLMKRLRNAGTDHRKFMRMITVYVDITAPLYWWKEFDTYKVGTVANSCSTMHKIADKEFTLEDFSYEHLFDRYGDPSMNLNYGGKHPIDMMIDLIQTLNHFRHWYLETKDKKYWWQMIQLLPSSYNQKRTVMMNYEVLANIYKSRKNHKLDEWREHKVELVGDHPSNMYPTNMVLDYLGFCDWIKTLPYSELITGEYDKNENIRITAKIDKLDEETKEFIKKEFQIPKKKITCREKLKIEHPDLIKSESPGGCLGCPDDYGYAKEPDYCVSNNKDCHKCWDRPVEEKEK